MGKLIFSGALCIKKMGSGIFISLHRNRSAVCVFPFWTRQEIQLLVFLSREILPFSMNTGVGISCVKSVLAADLKRDGE